MLKSKQVRDAVGGENEEKKPRKRGWRCVGRYVLHRVVGGGLSEMVAFE